MISSNKYRYIDSDIEIRELTGMPEKVRTLVIFNPVIDVSGIKEINRQLYINDTAYDILRLLDGEHTVQSIAEKLTQNPVDVETSITKINNLIELFKVNFHLNILESDTPLEKKVNIVERKNIYPMTATLELTENCNLRCIHCYGDFGAGKEMPIDSVMELLEDLYNIGVTNLELTGGDVSVYPYLNKVLKKIYNMKFSTVVILTNGIKMNDEFFDLVSANKGRTIVQIDIHSLDENYLKWFTKSNGFNEKIFNNVQRLTGAGVFVRGTSIITPRNVNELPLLAEKMDELGVMSYLPSIVSDIGRARDDTSLLFQDEDDIMKYVENITLISNQYPNLLKKVQPDGKKNNCGCITGHVVLSASGDIKICSMDSGYLTLGNVFNDRIQKIYDDNVDFIKTLYLLEFPSKKDKECQNCQYIPVCNYCFVRTFETNRNNHKESCKWFKNHIQNTVLGEYIHI